MNSDFLIYMGLAALVLLSVWFIFHSVAYRKSQYEKAVDTPEVIVRLMTLEEYDEFLDVFHAAEVATDARRLKLAVGASSKQVH